MMRSTAAFGIGVVILLSGCVRSLQPIYTSKDLVFKPELVGSWSGEEPKQVWTFEKSGEKEYRLVYTDKDGESGEFVVHLAKIGEEMFIDLYPADFETDQSDYHEYHLLPVHTFALVERIEPRLQMRFTNPGWLEEHLLENPDAVGHVLRDDEVILTAPTMALQAFWMKHLKTEGAFGEATDLQRKAEAEEAMEDRATEAGQ